MKIVDLVELIAQTIEQKVIKDWKHEGYIDVMHSNDFTIVIDGKKFVVSIKESN